jgi:hypothetical protein
MSLIFLCGERDKPGNLSCWLFPQKLTLGCSCSKSDTGLSGRSERNSTDRSVRCDRRMKIFVINSHWRRQDSWNSID